MRRIAVGTLAVAFALAVTSTPAGAATRPPGAYVDPGGDPTAVAGDHVAVSGGSNHSGGSSEPDPCEWDVVVSDDFTFAVFAEDGPGQRQHSRTGRWLQRLCPGLGAVAVNGFFLVPEGGLVDPAQLAADALASVSIAGPAIRTSPSRDGRLFVEVPTWLWLDGGWWHSYDATANAGRVSSTVRAVPVAARWNLGDGSTVECRGPGVAWRAGMSEDASTCTHTYRTSSAGRPDGTFRVEATVSFEVTWTTNAGGGGALAAITRSSSMPVEVREIQAIGTQGGQTR